MNTVKKIFVPTGWICILTLMMIAACQSPQKTETETAHATSSDTKQPAADSSSITLKNKHVKFLWRAEQFDPEYNATINALVLDEAYIKTISDSEKAALGYVATFIGNECAWDGKATPNRSNLKCKILTALDLGYQCSETHLGFLRHWFRSDSTALKKLENCPTIPDGSTVQETFDKINLSVKGDEIVVTYTVTSINMRENKSWTWDVQDHFKYHDTSLELVKTEKSEPTSAGFEVSDSDT